MLPKGRKDIHSSPVSLVPSNTSISVRRQLGTSFSTTSVPWKSAEWHKCDETHHGETVVKHQGANLDMVKYAKDGLKSFSSGFSKDVVSESHLCTSGMSAH